MIATNFNFFKKRWKKKLIKNFPIPSINKEEISGEEYYLEHIKLKYDKNEYKINSISYRGECSD